MNKLIKVFFN